VTTLLTLALLAPTGPALIPMPNRVAWTSGAFALGRETALVNEGASAETVARLREVTGLPLRGRKGASTIVLRKTPGMAAEAYALVVEPRRIEIRASGDAGLFYGIQTLRQLNQNGQVPACRIDDAPRFGWRGLMLDESRHFFGPVFVRKFIDDLAAHKLNVFHWHLTDDGGWRMETRRYPELTRTGAWRKEQGVEWDYGNLWFPGPDSKEKKYGGFYTQRALRDMVRYAQARHVTIVPEIEMPGHSTAAAASHPELQCEPPAGVKEAYLKGIRSQAPSMICPGKDGTIQFYKRVLDETMAVFPSKFIHIGADEVDKTLWRQCKHCQARMKANGLKDEHELQSWFVRQMDAYLASKGRRLIGWDEILEGGLAPGAAVMSWRGIQGGIAAAKAGHDVVMSPTSHCYFDYSYETTPLAKVYGYEPVPAELVGAERRRVLGGQANLWTEWISSPEEAESMAYPRVAALAETLWTAPEHKDWTDFQRRLDGHYAEMERRRIAFRFGTPALVPDFLNRSVTNEWTVTEPELPNARVVLADGTVVADGRVPFRGTVPTVYFQLPGGRRSAPAVGRVVDLKPVEGMTQPGLRRTWIAWKERSVPGLDAFAGGTVDTATVPGFDGLTLNEPFAMRFDGGLVVERPGRYAIGLGSDDGAVLYLGGQRLVDNDGEHAYRERAVTVDLAPGVYPLQILYFDAGGARRLEVFWTAPGGSRETIQNYRHL
jgi:hexosaminidase